MADKIMLVDGNSLINRGFYAMPLLTNKDGEYTNGVFGFLNIFFRLFDEIQPEYCAVCFDVHQPTFRHKMFGEYKGTDLVFGGPPCQGFSVAGKMKN